MQISEKVQVEDGEASRPEDIERRRDRLASRYREVRGLSEELAAPLLPEDQVVQSMPDVSPTKWHLAHTTWFFETFVLREFVRDYEPHNPDYAYLFNSYYVQAGDRFSRPRRGLLSRPSVAATMEYRARVDERIHVMLGGPATADADRMLDVVELGLNHEQQHQELILTDIKHVLSCNPLGPAYVRRRHQPDRSREMGWLTVPEGVHHIGHRGAGFSFDNEGPPHRVFLEPAEIADRLVTNREFLAFMEDGGYRRSELWLSDGWAVAEGEGWKGPGYWRRDGDRWKQFTLSGYELVEPDEPVCHVSYYEADAFARWHGDRLPTEFEWETVAAEASPKDNFVETRRFHPSAASERRQFYGDTWEWTQSAYAPYPGYRPAAGALGEYNSKFMCNQFVLRGGSCATSLSHIRRTYRNFFPPAARWQFTGIRLARDTYR